MVGFPQWYHRPRNITTKCTSFLMQYQQAHSQWTTAEACIRIQLKKEGEFTTVRNNITMIVASNRWLLQSNTNNSPQSWRNRLPYRNYLKITWKLPTHNNWVLVETGTASISSNYGIVDHNPSNIRTPSQETKTLSVCHVRQWCRCKRTIYLRVSVWSM